MQKIRLSEAPKSKEELSHIIFESIADKKGEGIVSLDLTNINDAITDFFIICHADSTTQVKAIADNIITNVGTQAGEKPWHKEGYENLEWVLIDYVSVVVHIFHKSKRAFYQLEDLWSDAVIKYYEDS